LCARQDGNWRSTTVGGVDGATAAQAEVFAGLGDLAETALTDALTQRLSQRRRGSVLTDLALLGVQRGDVDQVLKYGGTALESAQHTGSGWIGRKLQDVQAQLAPLASDTRITELDDQITALTRSA
jgi:hypothetical protein